MSQPFTVYAGLGAVVASLNALAMGLALGYSSPALNDIKDDLNMSDILGSLFGAIVCLGALIGAFVGGELGEKVGRRMTLISVIIPAGAGWLMIALTDWKSLLFIGRVLVGVAIGMSSFCVPTYIVEVTAPQLRGSFGALTQLQVTIGILLSYLLGMFMTWRWLAIASLIPSAACSIGMLFFPESPHWYSSRRRELDASESLRRLRGVDDVSAELAAMAPDNDENDDGPKGLEAYKRLFGRRYRTPVMVALGLMLCQQFSGINAMIFFANQIFEYAGQSDADKASVIFGSVQVAATLVSCMIIDKVGRRPLLLGSSLGMGISAFVMGIFFLLKSQGHRHGELALVSLLAYIVAFSMGMGPIPWLMMPEVLPNEVRASTGGVATGLNWISAFLIALTFSPLRKSPLRAQGCFWLYSGVCFAAFVFIFFVIPETKGRSLEDIERQLVRAEFREKRERLLDNA